MSLHLVSLTLDAHDADRLAAFWAGLLGRRSVPDPVEGVLLPPDDVAGVALRFVTTGEERRGPNVYHLDLTSDTEAAQAATVERALALGGRHLDIGQGPDVTHVVLADPEGNELCVIEPGNRFLAGCGPIGALNGDGSQACGYFRSSALGWPLVWDQDEETAVQSPRGGPKITWSGPPLHKRRGKARAHLDLAPPAGGDRDAEVARLEALGATRVDVGQGDVEWVVLADPDGHELCVRPPREART